MALLAHAMVSVAELKDYLGVSGTQQANQLERAINRATEWIETETGRHFVSRGALTEYHSVMECLDTIQLRQWPIVSVTSVHESTDSPRVYDSGTLLTTATEYQAVSETGQIRRLSSAALTPWASGYRTVQVIYTAGYQDRTGDPSAASKLPADLEVLCLFVAAAIFKEADRERWGLSSVTDATGTVQRFLGYLPADMRAHLESYRRHEFSRTWEAA